jgi:hypothetical protein
VIKTFNYVHREYKNATMANCSYKTTLDSGDEWECPCEALPGGERCYWHKEEERKEPTQERLEELKGKEIFGVYLIKAEL